MSLYNVKLMPQAQKDLDGFSGRLLSRFEKIILGLYDEPRPHNAKKLTGSGSRWPIKVGVESKKKAAKDRRSKAVKFFGIWKDMSPEENAVLDEI